LIEPDRAVSIERELFPRLVEEGSLCALALTGYWLDVGPPASYLRAQLDLLARGNEVAVHREARESAGVQLCSRVVIEPDVEIERVSRIGPFVHVGYGARAVLPRAKVSTGALQRRAIVAPGIGAISR
jgi:mannose-1-phosphate guanylyltransferase